MTAPPASGPTCKENVRFLYSRLRHRWRILRASAVINQRAVALQTGRVEILAAAGVIRHADVAGMLPHSSIEVATN
jgi:hypothetical protein